MGNAQMNGTKGQKNVNYKQQISTDKIERPKIIVGLVVDQMRWDYLYRY